MAYNLSLYFEENATDKLQNQETFHEITFVFKLR